MRQRPYLPILFALAFASPAAAQSAVPAVGATIPALAALDTSGKPADLASVAGRAGTVLVFFRSAKWCPYCQKQLIDLKAAQAPLAKRGYTLAAISYDSPTELAAFAAKRGIGYALLSDPGSRTIDAFGLRDADYAPGSYAHGVPRPMIFVLSPSGKVNARLNEAGYKSRPPVASVLAAVDRANATAAVSQTAP